MSARCSSVMRGASRFLGVLLWYEPLNRSDEAERLWVRFLSRVTYPLPFLAMLVLLFTSFRERLSREQWTGVGVFLLYCLPYILISYYERYAVPLLAIKVLLVL